MHKESTTPKASLEVATELYQKQKETLNELDWCLDKRLFDDINCSQKRYEDYVRELATRPEVVNAIPDFARNGIGSEDFKNVAWHVVYLSQNLAVFDDLYSASFIEDHQWHDNGKMLHRLQDHEADVIIEHLKSKKEDGVDWVHLVRDYIVNNRRKEHLNIFISDNKLINPEENCSVISYFKTPECTCLLKDIAEKQGYPSKLYDEVLRLQIPEGWEAIKSFNDENNKGEKIAEYGSQEDLTQAISYIESLPIEKRQPYIKQLLNFGSVRIIDWLFKELDNNDTEYRTFVFGTMCEFLLEEFEDYEPHPDLDEVIDAYEHYDMFEPGDNEWDDCMFSSENLKGLWKEEVQPIISEMRAPDTRYFSTEKDPFDQLAALNNLRYAPDRNIISKFIDSLIIYTGQFFPYDRYAYVEKQEAQLDVWQQFLEENREQFLPGRWVRWGKYLD